MNDAPATGRRRWVWGVIAAMGLGGLGLMGCWLAGRSLVQSQMSALRAQGEKLTFDELAIPFLTNGAPRTQRLVDAVNAIQSKPAALGLITPMQVVAPGRARALAREDQLLLHSEPLPWSELEAQLDALAPQVARIRECVQEVEPDFGTDPRDIFRGIRRPFGEKRTAAQLLILDVVRHLHAGRLAPAQASLHALAQIAHLHEREPTLIAQLFNAAILDLGVRNTWEALQVPGWTEAQLAGLQRDWESFDVASMFEWASVGERAMGLEYFSMIKTARGRQLHSLMGGGRPTAPSTLELARDAVVLPFFLTLILPGDERMFLSLAHRPVESARALKAGRPALEVQAELSQRSQGDWQRLESWWAFRCPVTRMLLPNHAKALQKATRTETWRRLGVVAIALERHRLQHGSPPSSLADLVPRFLRAMPKDPLDGRPLRYRLEVDGSWALWSIGEDGIDQNGDATNVKPGAGGREVWDGRDWVWPRAASRAQVAAFDAETAARKARGRSPQPVPR